MTVTARKEWRGWLERCAGFGDEPEDKERAVWKESFKDLSKEDKALVKEIHEQVAREREIANGIDQSPATEPPDAEPPVISTVDEANGTWFGNMLVLQQMMLEELKRIRVLLESGKDR